MRANHPHRNWRRRMEGAASQWAELYRRFHGLELPERMIKALRHAYEAGYQDHRDQTNRNRCAK